MARFVEIHIGNVAGLSQSAPGRCRSVVLVTDKAVGVRKGGGSCGLAGSAPGEVKLEQFSALRNGISPA